MIRASLLSGMLEPSRDARYSGVLRQVAVQALMEDMMRMLFPLILDGAQPARESRQFLDDVETPRSLDVVLVRTVQRMQVQWLIAPVDLLIEACSAAGADDDLATAMLIAPFHVGTRASWATAMPVIASSIRQPLLPDAHWRVITAGARVIGVVAPVTRDGRTRARGPRLAGAAPEDVGPMPPDLPPDAPPDRPGPPSPQSPPGPPPAPSPMQPPGPGAPPPIEPPSRSPQMPPMVPTPMPIDAGTLEAVGSAPSEPLLRGRRRSRPAHATRAGDAMSQSAGATMTLAVPDDAAADDAEDSDTLAAMARVELPASLVPAPGATATLVIGLSAPPSPTTDGVMHFITPASATTFDIDVMVEAPDFTCVGGWKHRLTVSKSSPFTDSITLALAPVTPVERSVRTATVRVHYGYRGQPAGVAVRTIALGDATAAEIAGMPAPSDVALHVAPSNTPVDLTIRIARRDQSDAARDLIWTLLDCAHAVALPDAPLIQKVGDRDTASSFASKVTNQVNAADGTVTIDNMMRSIGTLIRRAMPVEVLRVLQDVAKAVGASRLPRVLLLTDECHVPWELALMDTPPNAARAPYLGAQFAVSRWIHGETDIPVPPPATLSVRDLAIVLGSYEASNQAPLPHAKEEATALADEASRGTGRFPRVTRIEASADSLVDLLNGTVPCPSGTMAPELVHFACHGEVLGTGIAKRSVLYMNDGTPMSDLLFASSALGRNAKSFLFMNACQVGVGGEELGMYAGFAGMAIGAGFSGFVGPLWSVNDQIAKRIAVEFYQHAFGTDGSAPRPVADVLSDMRSQYLSESDPRRRQSTWLAYVHYGHPHFTLAHA